jgi:hypothetical protein
MRLHNLECRSLGLTDIFKDNASHTQIFYESYVYVEETISDKTDIA